MAGHNTGSIRVPVQLQMQVQNSIEEIKKLRSTLEREFENVDVSSNLGKQLSKLMTKVNQGFASIEATNLGTELFDEAEFKRVVKYIDQINDALQTMRVYGMSASAQQLGLDTKPIEDATKAYKELNAEYQKYLKSSVASANPDKISRFEQYKKKTGFKSGQSHQQNIETLAQARERTQAELNSLNSAESIAKRDEAKKAYDEASKIYKEAEERYKKAQEDNNKTKQEIQKQEQLLAEFKAANRFKDIKGTGKGRKKEDVISDYKTEVGKLLTKNGNFVQGGKQTARVIAQWLGKSEEEIDVLLKNEAEKIVKQLQTELGNAMSANLNSFSGQVRKASGAYSQEQHTSAVVDAKKIDAELTQAKAEFTAAESKQASAKAAYDQAFELFENTEQLLHEIEEEIEILQQLDKDFQSEAKTKYSERLKQAREKIEETKKESTREARENIKNTAEKIASESKKVGGTSRNFANENQERIRRQMEQEAERRRREEQARAEARREQQEADTFRQNLHASLKHWISIQSIITLTKDGIRQAWQDIQGLDQAMTNIAVVTDMSVSDLWGKIDEYMSIAKEYGVTTKGVYEVSQLYYQQGLSTSEVMAATSETLKMARIAGMDYADAADAMTVAIRAFKMEMSDAQIITDVYSKVAAVTASDSQELAIAMSKTASSAESVGSSFENTTAMLAVMIETTRESAQNLGSALKSIISRYGEMKTGLTVDSDGEAIDYNKVDTALQSVGISIKDAQGQFRDFDDVIFELSKKWDSLDKNTQRYIATIMAGNRQQSRFIALVDNWERLDEVSQAAYDSEDAGLLQYAKTLDSLETKLNSLATSFQQFYMKIINGDTFKGIIELITSIVDGFGKLGSLNSILSVFTLIRGLRIVLNTTNNLFASTFNTIYKNYKDLQEKMTFKAFKEAKKRADNQEKVESQAIAAIGDSRKWSGEIFSKKNIYAIGGQIANAISLGLTTWGIYQAASGEDRGGTDTGVVRGAKATALGNSISSAVSLGEVGAAIGGAIGTAVGHPAVGTAIGAAGAAIVAGLGSYIAQYFTSIKPAIENVKKERLERYSEESSEKNIARAEAKEEFNNLKLLLDKYKVAEENRYNSEEDYATWIEVNNALVEAYPVLLGYIDEEGNAIANVTEATDILTSKMLSAAEATNNYYNAKLTELKQQYKVVSEKTYQLPLSNILKSNRSDKTNPIFYKGYTKNGLPNPFSDIWSLEYTEFLEGIPKYRELTIPEIEEWLKFFQMDIYDLVDQASGRADHGISSEVIELLTRSGLLIKGDKDYFLDPDYESYLSRENILKEIEQTQITQMQQHMSLLSKNTTLDDDFSDISGYTDLLITYAQDFHNFTQEQINDLSIEEFETLVDDFKTFYQTLNTDNQAILKTLYDSLNNLSAEDLDDILLTDFNLEIDNPIYELFVQKWFDANYKTKQKFAKAIWGDNFNAPSYTEWLKTKEGDQSNTAENRQAYSQMIDDLIMQYDEELGRFIVSATETTLEKYTGYIKHEEKVVEGGGNSGSIASARMAYIKELISNGLLNQFEEDKLTDFVNLLFSDDIGTQNWAQNVHDFIKDNDIDFKLDLFPYVYENINTQVEAIYTLYDSVVKDLDTLADKQSKGYTAEEAQSLMNKLGLEGRIDDYFIVSGGQLIAKSYGLFVEATVEKFNNTSQSLQNSIREAQEIVTAGYFNGKHYTGVFADWLEQIKSGQDITEQIAATLFESGFDPALADEIAREIQNGNITTNRQLEEYLYKRYQGIVLADESLSQLIADYSRKNKVDITPIRNLIEKGFTSVTEAEIESLSKILNKPFEQVIQDLNLQYNKASNTWSGTNFHTLLEKQQELWTAYQGGDKSVEQELKDVSNQIFLLTQGDQDLLDPDSLINLYSTQGLALKRALTKSIEDSFKDGEVSYSDLEDLFDQNQDSILNRYDSLLFEYNEALNTYILKDGVKVDETILKDYGITQEDWNRWIALGLKNWKSQLDDIIGTGGKSLNTEERAYAELALKNNLGIKEEEVGSYFKGDSLDIQALANLGYEAAVSYVSGLTNTINNDFNSYFEDLTKVEFDDLTELYKNITGKEEIDPSIAKEYQIAVEQAKKGNTKLLSDILLKMVDEAKQYGYDIDTTLIQNTIQDAALALMAAIVQTVEAGIDGTMTNTDYTQLLKDIGVNQFEPDGSISKDWERWQGMVYSTNEGLQFTKQGILDIYGVVSSRNAMASQGILEMIAEDYREYDNLSSTLAHIRELRDLRDKADPTKRKQYEQELEVAEKIAKLRSQDPDSFNFMDRAIPDEIQSPLNVWQNAADAASALQDAKKNGYMGAEDFYRIVTTASEYMTAAGQEFSVAGMNYEQLISAATSSLATANGNLVVDFSKFGVNFAGGIDDMAGGLEDGLKELAKQQIEMLDGMIAMLETMKTIQEAANAIKDENGNGLFDFEELFNFDELTGIATLKEETIAWWNEFQSVFGIMTFDGLQLDDAWKKGIIKATEITKFMNDAQNIIDNATSDIDGMIDQIVGAAQAAFGTDVAVKLGLNLEKQFEFKDDGTVIYNGTTYPNEAAALTAWKQEVSKTTDEFAEQIGPIVTEDGTTITYKRDLKTDIIYEVHTDKNGVTTYKVNEIPCKTETELAEQLAKVTPEAKDLEGQTESNQFLSGGTYAGVEYTIGKQVQVTIDGEGSTILGPEESLADYLKTYFEAALTPEENTNSNTEGEYYPVGKYNGIQIDFGSNIKVGDTDQTIAEYVSSILTTALEADDSAKVSTELTVTADTSDADGKLQEIIKKLQTIEKAKSRSVSVTATTSSAYNQLTAIISALKQINSKSITVTTTYTQVGNPPSNNNPDVDIVSGAGARGNVALAKGTLMGELGPELYVQNGSYHIAGSNGPEFVDLADDAIVFNHLQTKRILNTGHSFGRGTPITNERRAVAWATGNVTGPALAGGIDSAIEQLKTAREFWKGLLNQLSLSELMSGSGGHKGGGSGNSIKAVTEELQEWYNLSRQIADIEQDINNLLAERENIEWSNGEEYLKSLREQQKLLQQQMATQQALLDYQELQLKRQAEHINQNRIWSQFLTVGADGLLQYIEGNETNGGKGALQVLQELNQMSGEQQTAYLKSIGYSYTNNDGKKLEGQELVEQFFQELQDQIDQYDSLYDTVHGTQETLEELQTSINDINDQIKENQMELEEEIFDIIVEALEKEIEVLEEQADLIEEANEAYISGLNEALSAERQMYDDNQKVADREQLQRQLSLLRRSGGSASEIANLEEQLNDMLKDEYFTNQERMIEDIKKANDLQVQQLQTQIKLQEDSLEYQKEHGVIWTQVYQVLAQSKDEILAFMQGQKPEFFSQSLLQQEAMLTEWAHKIGIYSEDRKYQNFAEHARNNLWDNGQAWNLGDMSKYQSTYNTLTDEEKNTIRDQFTSVYAQARLDGKDHTTAANEAAAAVSQTLKRKQDANNSQNNQAPTTNPNPQNPVGGDNGGSSSDSTSSSSSNENPNEMTHWKFTYNGKTYKHYKSQDSAISKMQALGREYLAANPGSMSKVREMFEAAKKTLKSGKHYAQGYSEGGLVDYTGVAVVHGSKTKPESFLNAEQTAQIREGLKESGKGGALEGIKAALLKLDSSIKAVTNISNKTESNSYTVAPGAVVIQVEQLNDAYDVDTLSADIMNRMYAIGNKSTNRGVSRR